MAYLDDYDDSAEKAKGRRRSRIIIVVAVVAVVALIGAALLAILGQQDAQQKDDKTDDGTQTVQIAEGDDHETTTESGIVGGQPEEIETTVETPTDVPAEQQKQDKQDKERQEHMNDNSASIPIEKKMEMAQNNEIDEETEQKYAQYGALNIDRMSEVARNWVNEWTQMVNDAQWDEHSAVLKSMMDIDYVKNHSTEFEVSWLYECLMDSLYVSPESMRYDDIADIQIVNSVPSPLTYVKVKVNTTVLGTDSPQPGSITYKLGLNKDYLVCRFAPVY